MATLGMLQACQSKEEKKATKSNTEIINEVNTVLGVGKVLPKDGWVVLSASVAGQITDIYVQEGDSVKAQQPLFRIKDVNNRDIELQEAKLKLSNSKAQTTINAKDIEREQLKLAELQEKLATSTKLYAKNAETLENLQADQYAVSQQRKLIESLISKQRIDRFNEQEQQLLIEKSANNIDGLVIKAPQAGIINELTAEIGQSITTSTELGKIVDNSQLIIEAEVDELFANKVAVGQIVTLYAVGRTDSIGTGKIIYASPTLMNKSILYESIGESEDRRVRRLKIQPQSNTALLINAKVECQIKIK